MISQLGGLKSLTRLLVDMVECGLDLFRWAQPEQLSNFRTLRLSVPDHMIIQTLDGFCILVCSGLVRDYCDKILRPEYLIENRANVVRILIVNLNKNTSFFTKKFTR